MNLIDFAMLNIKGTDYCCIISEISKSEAVNVTQNINLTKKKQQQQKKNRVL